MRNHSYENDFDLHQNEIACRNHFHMKGFALRLGFQPRHKRTRKWPICHVEKCKYSIWVCCKFLLHYVYHSVVFLGLSSFNWVKVNYQIVPHSWLFLGRCLPVWRRPARPGNGRAFDQEWRLSKRKFRGWLLLLWWKALQTICKFVLCVNDK